jgi:hypothetical protein
MNNYELLKKNSAHYPSNCLGGVRKATETCQVIQPWDHLAGDEDKAACAELFLLFIFTFTESGKAVWLSSNACSRNLVQISAKD